jgi:hypothetical protein
VCWVLGEEVYRTEYDAMRCLTSVELDDGMHKWTGLLIVWRLKLLLVARAQRARRRDVA